MEDNYLVTLAGNVKTIIQAHGDAQTKVQLMKEALIELRDGLERICGLQGHTKLRHSSYQQIFQACHLIFSKVLTQIVVYDGNLNAADGDHSIETLSCEVLSWLSKINPDEMLLYWPLFLTDTFKEEKSLELLYYDITSNTHITAKNVSYFESHKWHPSSPLLYMACMSCEPVQMSAITCINDMINSRQLHKWMRLSSKRGASSNGQTSKILKYLTKVVKIMTVMLQGWGHCSVRVTKGILQLFDGMKFSIDFDNLHHFPNLMVVCRNFVDTVAKVAMDVNFEAIRNQSLKRESNAEQCLEWLCFCGKAKVNENSFILQQLVILSFDYRNGGTIETVRFPIWLVNAFSVCCQKKMKLQDSLITICAVLLAKFVSSSDSWGTILLLQLTDSKLSGERLLFAKTIAIHLLQNGEDVSLHLFAKIFNLILDENHLVQIASLEAIATMTSTHWKLYYEAVAKMSYETLAETISSVFILMSDPKGTVRAAAFKAFGEMICGFPDLPFKEEWLQYVVKGSEDTKLAVRIQAMWCMSKLYELKVLPRFLNEQSSFDHSTWLKIMQICNNSLQDSEKIQATAIRTLSCFLASTIFNFSETSPSRSEAVQVMTVTLELVVDKFFPSWDEENISEKIYPKAHKLICALADLFGCICFISFEHNIDLPRCNVMKLLVCIFRYGGLQSRLTALRTLVALVFHPGAVSFQSADAEWFLHEVLLILENERGSILKASIVRECSDPIENLQILRSSELRRTLVMSLYGVARLNVIPTNIMIELFGQHIDVVLSLLEINVADGEGSMVDDRVCLLYIILDKSFDRNLRHKVITNDFTQLLSEFMEEYNLGTIQLFRLQNLMGREISSFRPSCEYRYFGGDQYSITNAFIETSVQNITNKSHCLVAEDEDEI